MSAIIYRTLAAWCSFRATFQPDEWFTLRDHAHWPGLLTALFLMVLGYLADIRAELRRARRHAEGHSSPEIKVEQ